MATRRMSNLIFLEGRQVNVALRDGTRIDDCSLVSAGRQGVANLWVFVGGEDVFVPHREVIEVWESRTDQYLAA